MRFTEGGPAEFLFGSLSTPYDEVDFDLKQPKNPGRWEVLLLFTGIMYVITITMLITFVSEGLFTDSWGIYSGIFLILSFLATLKNYIQLKRYGTYLEHYNRISFAFMLVQTIFAHILAAVCIGGFYILLIDLKLFNFYVSITLLGFICFVSYAKIISNISLITGSLGIGIIPTIVGFSNSVNNLKLISQIQGRKEYHLAILRIIFITSIIGANSANYSILYQALLITSFLYLFVRLEKINASSSVMQIRSIIHSMAPATLPEISFDRNRSYIMRRQELPDIDTSTIEVKQSHSRHNGNKKSFRSTSSISPMKEDLTPIATKSINRIVSSIMKENTQ